MFLWAPLLVAAVIQSAPVDGVTGQGAVTLSPITSTASGQVSTSAGPITGQATVTLGEVQSASAGLVGSPPAIGQAGITLGDVQSTAAGTVVSLPAIVGVGTVTLGAVVSVARGGEYAPINPVDFFTVAIQPREYLHRANPTTTGACAMRAFKSNKAAGEVVPLAFDFSALTDTPTSPIVTITRMRGVADASPTSMLSGQPQVSGALVVQRIVGGVAGCTYRIQAQVDAPDGSRWIESALLAVK